MSRYHMSRLRGTAGGAPQSRRMKTKLPVPRERKIPLRKRKNNLHVDLASLLSIDHSCRGCATGEPCCCSTYEVCVTDAEMNRIIQVLPEAAKLCPHLETGDGYDNVFEKVGADLFALDTTEDGLCLFAYVIDHTIRCSLHTAGTTLGLPLWKVKPKACLLWPMNFSEGNEVLSLTSDALSFRCNARSRKQSRILSPALVAAIELVYGEGVGTHLEKEAGKGGTAYDVELP